MDAATGYAPTPPGAPPRTAPRLDFADTLKDGWALFAGDWLALSVGIMLALVLTFIPPLVLAPIVWAGVMRMVLRRVREGRPAEIGDVFSCFDRFFALWGVTLVVLVVVLALFAVAAIPLLFAGGFQTDAAGQLEPQAIGAIVVTAVLALLMSVPAVYLETVWTYAYVLIVDETRCGVFESLSVSRRLVHDSGFWMTFALLLVVSFIASAVNNVVGMAGAVAGLVTLGVGFIPFFFIGFVPYAYLYTCTTSMYFQASGERGGLPSARVMAPVSGGYAAGPWSPPSPPPAG